MRGSFLVGFGLASLLLIACGGDAAPPAEDSESPVVARPSGSDPAKPGAGAPAGAPDPSSDGGPGMPSRNACSALPNCNNGTAPEVGVSRDFAHFRSTLIAGAGPSFHRGRDQIVSVGDEQWVIGNFVYSFLSRSLTDEEVDVFVERSCGAVWEKLGTAKTTEEGAHAPVDGVTDSGGRVYFQIPKDRQLATGRHRIRLVVAGDHTSTDLLIDVLPKGTPIVVSDVDGTLTSSESAEWPALLTGALPDAQPRAPDVMSAFAAKGYHVVYLTARPEWLTGRTREFLATRGFPAGIVRTTTGSTGVTGGSAALFKTAELARFAAHGHTIAWGFGNKASDTEAYESANVPVDHRVFLGLTDPHGGRRIEAYSDILPAIRALSPICK